MAAANRAAVARSAVARRLRWVLRLLPVRPRLRRWLRLPAPAPARPRLLRKTRRRTSPRGCTISRRSGDAFVASRLSNLFGLHDCSSLSRTGTALPIP